MPKIIIAQVSVQENHITSFLEFAEIMVRESNAESGCLVYKLLNDVAEPTDFIFYEEYTDQAAIDVHNNSKHFATFVSQISDMLTKEPNIQVL